MGPVKSGRIYPILQVLIKDCSQGPKFSYVPTNHHCVVTCDLKLFIPGPMTQTKHPYFPLCQLKSEQFLLSCSCPLSPEQNTDSFNKLAYKCLARTQRPRMLSLLYGICRNLNHCNNEGRDGSYTHYFASEKNPME